MCVFGEEMVMDLIGVLRLSSVEVSVCSCRLLLVE